MARRESTFSSLVALPWWASAIAACVVYIALAYGAPAFLSGHPVTTGAGKGLKSLAPFFAGLFAAAGILSFIGRLLVARKFDRQEGLAEIRKLTWQQFELIVGEAFRRRGYSVVQNGGADGGIDLVLRKGGEKYYVQCKQWKVLKVGVKPVRELFGVISASEVAGGFFVTSGAYTEDARAFAKESGVELIDGVVLEQMVREAQTPEPFLDPTIGRRNLNTTFTAQSTVQSCPRCSGEMVRRSAKSGANAGGEFWGCSQYPLCRGTRPV